MIGRRGGHGCRCRGGRVSRAPASAGQLVAGGLIFLLGAGASKDAGLPLMADLTTGFPPWLAARGRADGAALDNLFQAAVAAVSVGQALPNIELVLQLLGDLTVFRLGAHAKTGAGWHPPLDAPADVVRSLSTVIRAYIRETLLTAPAASGDYLSAL